MRAESRRAPQKKKVCQGTTVKLSPPCGFVPPKECVVCATDPSAKAVTYTSLGPALESLALRLNGAVC